MFFLSYHFEFLSITYIKDEKGKTSMSTQRRECGSKVSWTVACFLLHNLYYVLPFINPSSSIIAATKPEKLNSTKYATELIFIN